MMMMVVCAVSLLIGVLMGAIGMFLLIKETRLDLECEEEPAEMVGNPAPDLELEDELEMPKEVKYGEF